MKKIPTIFVRDWNGDRSRVTQEPHPDCAWVFAGEGIATRKRDGKAIMVRSGVVFRRFDAAKNDKRPLGFESCGVDEETGKEPGWAPGLPGDDEWFDEAIGNVLPMDGTYELCGPKIGTRAGANPEGLATHVLFRHGGEVLENVPRLFDALKSWFIEHPVEGVVFHHPDGRMGKIKRSDFGILWGSKKSKDVK